MYQCILVPLDGSKRAEAILPHVEELAIRFQAKLIFLQVVEPIHVMPESEIPFMGGFQEQMKRKKEQAELYLKTINGEFREKGIQTKIRVSYGSVIDWIINAAESEGADLIAITSHGRTGLSRVFYGSVAVGVLHSADRPLLVIRSE